MESQYESPERRSGTDTPTWRTADEIAVRQEPMRFFLNGEPLAEVRMGSDGQLAVEVNEAQAMKLRALWEECSPEPPADEPRAIRFREFT